MVAKFCDFSPCGIASFVSRGSTNGSADPVAVVWLLSLKRHAHVHDCVGRSCTCRCEGGLRRCFVSASNDEFGGDPCINTRKYLQVNYRCLSDTGINIRTGIFFRFSPFTGHGLVAQRIGSPTCNQEVASSIPGRVVTTLESLPPPRRSCFCRCLFVCLLATLALCAKTSERICVKFSGKVEQTVKFLCRSRTDLPDDGTDIATLLRRALAEVCTVPVLPVFSVTKQYNFSS